VAPENQAQAQSSGSFWMPLMAGYMMGRLMGGGMGAQQPLFSSKNPASPAYGQYTDASGKLRRSPAGRTATCRKPRWRQNQPPPAPSPAAVW
jgi:uncharacterized protein YgiB involved in biofilm formation